MAVTSDVRTWSDLFARRTHTDVGSGIAEILALLADSSLISFAGGFPDPATFASEYAREAMQQLDPSAFQYTPTRGLASALDAVASRLEPRPDDAELMLTSGGIEGLELVSKSFLDPGDTALVEGPTYLGAIMAFRSFEANVVAVDLDDDGLDPDRITRTGAKLLYTIPDHQNPAGVSMSLERRRALVELARAHGFLIVEDVAYRELGFDGSALPSLWSLGPDVTVQLGTTSKTFFPGVRLGWAAGPAEVITQLVAAKQNTDQCAGGLGQRLYESYVRSGTLDAQLAKSRALYERRCRTLLGAFERLMPETVRWTTPRGGFFTWVTLPPDTDATAFARAAAADGVAVVPGTLFYPDGRGSDKLRLSFSLVSDERIEEGAARLAALLG
jgi:2-aminoadipate transaminase